MLVDNPVYHPRGDFRLRDGWVEGEGGPRLTFSGIAAYRAELFAGCTPGRQALRAILETAIERGEVSGEHFRGRWFNVGTPAELRTLENTLRTAG